MKQEKHRDNHIATIVKLRKTNDKETILKVVLKKKSVRKRCYFQRSDNMTRDDFLNGSQLPTGILYTMKISFKKGEKDTLEKPKMRCLSISDIPYTKGKRKGVFFRQKKKSKYKHKHSETNTT